MDDRRQGDAPAENGAERSFASTEATTGRGGLNPKTQPLEYAFQIMMNPLLKSLRRIEAKLDERATSAGVEPVPVTPLAILEPVVAAEVVPAIDRVEWDSFVRKLDEWTAALGDFRAAALAEFVAARESLVRAAAAQLPLVAPSPAANDKRSKSVEPVAIESQSTESQWERILLGRELCGQEELASVRRQCLQAVMSGDVAARSFAGQLLLVQDSAADEFPERLRHVGEAYYRWRPRTSLADDPFETSLAEWLTRNAENAGFRLAIELVRPGDRFDSTRHSSTGRGVEVVAVHGWVVIRDGHKVYTKANVSVR